MLANFGKMHKDPTSVPVDFLKRLKRELDEEAERGVSCAIASYEGLVDLSREDIEFLFEKLGGLFEDISIHLYLRRQDLVVMSHYSTALRGGGTRRTLLQAVPDTKDPALNYELLLDSWASILGQARIHPRVFQPEDMNNGDLIEDFLNVLGTDSEGLIRPPNVNVALSDDAKLFLRSFNKYVPARVDGKPNPLRGPVFHLLDDLNGPREMRPSREQALKFYEPFRESNSRVLARWFPARASLFDEDFSEYPEAEIKRELTAEAAVRVAAHLWQSLMKQRASQKEVDAQSGGTRSAEARIRGRGEPSPAGYEGAPHVAERLLTDGEPAVFCCNICGHEGRFLGFGAKRSLRRNARCPKCGSLERTRFQCLAIDALCPDAAGRDLLELAPTKALHAHFLKRGFVYTGVDLDPERGHFEGMNVKKADLCEDGIESLGRFNVIVNSHVMEHVRCDYFSVIKRLTDLLAVGGLHFISVPFGGRRTVEDMSADLSPQDRNTRFGHPEHVRALGSVEFPEGLKAIFGDRFAEIPKQAFLRDGRDVFAINQHPGKRDFNRLFVVGAEPLRLALD